MLIIIVIAVFRVIAPVFLFAQGHMTFRGGTFLAICIGCRHCARERAPVRVSECQLRIAPRISGTDPPILPALWVCELPLHQALREI